MNPLKVHVWKCTLELSKRQFHLIAEKYLENKWWSVSFEFVWFNNNHETLLSPSTWMEHWKPRAVAGGWGSPWWAERWWRAAFKVKLTITGGGDQAGDSHTVTGSTFVSNNNTILRQLSTPTVRPSAQRQLRYIEWKGEKIMIFKKLHFPLISSFILQG